MRRQISVRNGSICQICELFGRPALYGVKFAPVMRRQPQRSLYTGTLRHSPPRPRGFINHPLASRHPTLSQLPRGFFSSSDGKTDTPPATKEVRDLEELVKSVSTVRERVDALPKYTLLSETSVLAALSGLETAGGSVVDAASLPPNPATSTLLDLDDDEPSSMDSYMPTHSADEVRGPSMPGPYRDAINIISDTAYRLVAHPNVFLSPAVLEKYVRIQSRLGLPESLGHVFELYATKPMPRKSKNGVKYVDQNPDSYKNAIPKALANMAIDTAIAARNLDAAVAIIQASFDTKAYRRNKIFHRAFLPAAAVILTPVAIYDISSSVAAFQNTMEPGMATFVFFTGITAYVGFTASLGLIARMSSNDEVKRVSWALGVPLRHRWLHEEQRAAYEKVASSWGFVETTRFGEETGDEWATLKEYLGQKGMILDAVELMEGMQ